jgi:hypothetical protein
MKYKIHPDFPNYKIYDTGDIYGGDGKRRKLEHTIHDRYRIDLYHNAKRKRFQVHTLVALLFIPNPENRKEINHKDGNPMNNHVDNLEWSTRSENIQHAYDCLGMVSPRGWGNGAIRFSDEEIIDMRERSKKGESYKSIARFYKTSGWYVSTVVNRKVRKILGYAPESGKKNRD